MAKTSKNAILSELMIFALSISAPTSSYSSAHELSSPVLYLPLVFQGYPCYSIEVLPTVAGAEYRFRCQQYHFMTLVYENGAIIFRPHPGRDANGWGSSWYAQPFLAGALLRDAIVESIVAYPNRIHVSTSGFVSRSGDLTYGTWNLALDFVYDSFASRVGGTGTFHVILDDELTGGIGDLNLYKIASNHLEDVPLLGGGVGDTGDMVSTTVTINDSTSFAWTPPSDHCPMNSAKKLSVNVSGAYNNVDTAAQGLAAIEPAYKPSLSVVLSSTQQIDAAMIFCGFYAEAQSKNFAADNVAIHAIVRQGTIPTEFHYRVDFASLALPDECSLPSSC
jgi:hypothetical protein